ncbi:MAG: hypothetical protein LBC97_01760 [Bifidobacteriaceae bacterium]|nr:hypothetical protein [Bifidobacteriaceae bacterium]
MAGRSDRGSITAELALTLPAVVGLMAIVLVIGSAAVSQLAVAGGARAGARAAALGQNDTEIQAAAQAVAGGGVTVQVSRGDGLVRVTCARAVPVPPFGHRLAHAEAVAACEPARGCG